MMTRNTIPAEDCVFRLDYRDGYRQAFPMTFNNVGLNEDGFVFDGSSSQIVCGSGIPLNNLDFSCELFLKITGTPVTGYPRIIDFLYKDGLSWYGFNILYVTDFSVIALEIGYSGGASSSDSVSAVVDTDEFYHIIFTNESLVAQKVYVNGVLIRTDTVNGEIQSYSNDLILKICDTYLPMVVKHIAIYDKVLTTQECTDRYNEVTFNVE